MVKRIGRRFVSLLLTFVTILTMLPAMTLPALAATSGTVTGLADENIGLSFVGEANNAWSAGSAQIIGKVRSTPGSGCSNNKNYRSTLTITNKKSSKATLSFDYTVVVSSGTILVDNAIKTTKGSFKKELEAGGTVEVEITSGDTSADTQITITNISLVVDVSATVTFRPAENGSYTVDGKTIPPEYTSTQSSTTAYEVVATPAEGYRFMYWYDVNTGTHINTNAKAALNFDHDCTITARFVSKDLALFEANGQKFADLGEAITEAQKNLPATITLVGSGKITGNYTIPSKVTLLIPFDDNRTDYTTMPGTTGLVAAKKNQSVYTTLTMDEESQITVYGNISLPAKVSSANSSYTGVISGPCGTIHMKPSSKIVLKNGSNLYCWGFITGTGNIKAESGATVYEEFQICDYRGGNATSTLNGDKKVFPFTQYYVQNIEATLEIEYGAKETAVCRLHSSRLSKADVSLNFITQDSGGLFNLQRGSSFVKKYDSATERVTYEVIGDANLSSIEIDAGATTVKSQNFNLPIMQNTTINVKRGTTTIDQSLCLIPGSQVIVDKGATVKIANGKSIYVYDRSDWVYKEWDIETIDVGGQKKPKYINSGFTLGGSDFRPEYYTPSRSSDSWKSHFTTADMQDVKFDVNGTLNVEGKLYTTKGGADITSSLGSGKVVLSTAPTGDVKTHQYMQSRKTDYDSSTKEYKKEVPGYKEINATPAQLKNAADGSYTPTAGSKAGDTFTYCKCQDCGNGTWVKDVAAIINNGTQGDTYSTLEAAVKAYSPDNTTAPTNYIKLLHNTTEKTISVNDKSLYLDLNGRTVTGDITVTSGYKLYGMDSSTGKDYVTAPTGKIVGTVTGTVAPVFEKPLTDDPEYNYLRYVAIKNDAGTEYTFHRFNISVTGYRFELATGDTPQCALFFIGKFQGDKAAKDYLKSLGFTLTDIDGKTTKKVSCPMPGSLSDGTDTENSTVITDDGAYFFEAYLMRDINKENYRKQFSAIAQATFQNDETQNSETKKWSFQEALTKPEGLTGLTPEQKTILKNFLDGLDTPNQTE